jgi:hypothetical protein
MIIIVMRSRHGLHGPSGKHDIAHIASKYYLASSGAGFFFACRLPPPQSSDKLSV